MTKISTLASRKANRNTNRMACRREANRRRIRPRSLSCWNQFQALEFATLIEADTKGARAVLPRTVQTGDQLSVSFQDNLGQFLTRTARVAWTEYMESARRVIAGLAFEEDLVDVA